MISLRGQLIQASLPPDLVEGARKMVELIKAENGVIFKIISGENAASTPTQQSISSIKARLNELFPKSQMMTLADLAPAPLGKDLKEILPALLQTTQFLDGIQTPEQLSQAETALQQILQSSTGEVPKVMLNAAHALGTEANKISRHAFGALIRDFISQLESFSRGPSIIVKDVLNQLESMIEKLKDHPLVKDNDLDMAKKTAMKVISNLSSSLDGTKISSDTKSQYASIGNALGELRNLLGAFDPTRAEVQTDNRLATRAQEMSQKLARMAFTLESINTLNPLMQAMGEPALVLFPFLFQGMLAHTEVAIQPDRNEDRNEDRNKEDEDGGKSDKGKSKFQRIQAHVPLPNLGPVDVEIAFRDREILARFTTSGEEEHDFLLSQLEHLVSLLREQGYEKAEIHCNVGKQSEGHYTHWLQLLNDKPSLTA